MNLLEEAMVISMRGILAFQVRLGMYNGELAVFGQVPVPGTVANLDPREGPSGHAVVGPTLSDEDLLDKDGKSREVRVQIRFALQKTHYGQNDCGTLANQLRTEWHRNPSALSVAGNDVKILEMVGDATDDDEYWYVRAVTYRAVLYAN